MQQRFITSAYFTHTVGRNFAWFIGQKSYDPFSILALASSLMISSIHCVTFTMTPHVFLSSCTRFCRLVQSTIPFPPLSSTSIVPIKTSCTIRLTLIVWSGDEKCNQGAIVGWMNNQGAIGFLVVAIKIEGTSRANLSCDVFALSMMPSSMGALIGWNIRGLDYTRMCQ